MSLIKERVASSVKKIGMKKFENPIFYNSPIGIRFEISEPFGEVYCDGELNPKYLQETYKKVLKLYQNIPCKFDTILWNIYPNEYNNYGKNFLQNFMEITELPLPHEEYSEMIYLDENEEIEKISYYWDLRRNIININKLLEEISKADLGGFSDLVSAVFLFDTNLNVLFHYYDDRGLDIVSEKKETISLLYKNYNKWILDYDREKINKIFGH
jgi:hypothetical protein